MKLVLSHVGKDQLSHVGKDQLSHVGKDQLSHVGKDHTLKDGLWEKLCCVIKLDI